MITKRNATATIYKRERLKGNAVYPEFRVSSYDSAGCRTMKAFSSFAAAAKFAEARLDAIGRGVVDTTILSGPERLDYLSARKLLPVSATLTDAARAWLARESVARPDPVPVSAVVKAFTDSREDNTRRGKAASDVYLKDIRNRLRPFVEAFQCSIGDVTTAALEAWLTSSGLAGRNRFNTLRLIRTVMKWAQRRGHLPDGPLPTDRVEIVAPASEGPIGIFTPDELRRILAAAKPEMVPYAALGAFAGLRTAETARLDWSEVKLDRSFVEISAGKAKTASRRLVPALPALVAWLTPLKKGSGPVLPYASLGKQVDWLARDAGVEWKANGLRHSFISYRIAELQDVARVALEAGNSPAMVFKHYRELATAEEARAWFGVMPPAT